MGDAEFKALWADLCSTSATVQRLEAENEKLIVERDDYQARLQEIEPKVDELTQQLASLSEASEWHLREQSAQHFTVMAECADKIAELQTMHQAGQARRDEADAHFIKLREFGGVLQHRSEALEAEAAETRVHQQHLQCQIAELQNGLMSTSQQSAMQERTVMELHRELAEERGERARQEQSMQETTHFLHKVIAELSGLLLRGKKACAALMSSNSGGGGSGGGSGGGGLNSPTFQLPRVGWETAPATSATSAASELDVWVAEAEAELREEVRRSSRKEPGSDPSAATGPTSGGNPASPTQPDGALEGELERTRCAMFDLKRLQELLHHTGSEFFG